MIYNKEYDKFINPSHIVKMNFRIYGTYNLTMVVDLIMPYMFDDESIILKKNITLDEAKKSCTEIAMEFMKNFDYNINEKDIEHTILKSLNSIHSYKEFTK